MKIIATYQKINGTQREVIIDVPEVKSLYPTERQFTLCEDYVKLEQKDDEQLVRWKLVDNNLRGI